MTSVYVGNLDRGISENELRDIFSPYGSIEKINLKTNRDKPSYAFVDFRDERDAKEACRREDRRELSGRHMKVEISVGKKNDAYREKRRKDHSSSRSRSRDRRSSDRRSRYRRSYSRDRRSYSRDGRSYSRDRRSRSGHRKIYYDKNGIRHTGKPRRSTWRIKLHNVPSGVSWQDLKDFCKAGGSVIFTDLTNSYGIAEFPTEDEMRVAAQKLDGQNFKGAEIHTEVAVQTSDNRRDYSRRSYSRSNSYHKSHDSPRSANRSSYRSSDVKSRDESSKRSSSRSHGRSRSSSR